MPSARCLSLGVNEAESKLSIKGCCSGLVNGASGTPGCLEPGEWVQEGHTVFNMMCVSVDPVLTVTALAVAEDVQEVV